MQQADIIIIGSGQGALPLARDFAQNDRRVVLFERAQFGGTCVNTGCLPSKAFLASAHAAAQARNAGDLGIQARVEVDFHKVMERARATSRTSRRGVRQGLADAGVHLIEAEASFVDERTVQGGEVTVTAPRIVVNTGKSPAVPPIDGLQDVDFLTYQTFWRMKEDPRRTIVLGGGYVGVELGQGLARLGSEILVVERAQRIIEREEEDVSAALTEAMEADGVQFYLDADAVQIERKDNGICVELADGRTLAGDTLLVTTGRRPNTASLNPAAAGIELDDNGHVKVDEQFRTANPHVYAIGDVTGQPAFTHVSWEDFRRLRAILAGESRQQQDRVLGYAFFTEPQVGRVGLTLEQAKAKGYQAEAATLSLTNVAHAGLTGHERGFYRMVIDVETDKILGATLVGPQSAELIHVFMAHMEAGATWQVLERSVYIHPTFGEGLPVLARQFC